MQLSGLGIDCREPRTHVRPCADSVRAGISLKGQVHCEKTLASRASDRSVCEAAGGSTPRETVAVRSARSLSSTLFVSVGQGHSDVLLQSPLAQPPFLLVRRDDDDINDVASMAGVNLSEESARILATNSELVGTLTRSCKDETFLLPAPLQRRILEIGAPCVALSPGVCPQAGWRAP